MTEASENDKYVALQFPEKLRIAAKAFCRPAGIPARRLSWVKGQRVWTGGGDEAALSKACLATYIE